MDPVKKLSRSVRGLSVLVTGAASGMGRATAHAFADEGARVAVTDLSEDSAEAVAKEIRDGGGDAKAWALDVGDAEAITRVVDDVAKALNGLDVLINNAGIPAGVPVDHARYDEIWARALSVLLTAHQRTVRASLPYLRKSASPRIVNIASTEALGATARDTPYSAAKAGVAGLTRALAVELGPEGITVNCICPGPIRTAMTAPIPEEDKTIYAKRRTALRRYGDPEEVAHMTLSLCLPAASFLTGTVIPVDGGLRRETLDPILRRLGAGEARRIGENGIERFRRFGSAQLLGCRLIAQKARDARQGLEMIGSGAFGRQKHEDKIDGLIVDGIVVDRRFQPGEHARNFGDIAEPSMRNGDALPDACRAQAFTLHQRFEDLALRQTRHLCGPGRQLLQKVFLALNFERRDDGGWFEQIGNVHRQPMICGQPATRVRVRTLA